MHLEKKFEENLGFKKKSYLPLLIYSSELNWKPTVPSKAVTPLPWVRQNNKLALAFLGGILTVAKSFLFAAEGVEGADFLYVCPKHTDLLFSMVPIFISKYQQVSLWTGKIKRLFT